MLTVEQLRSLRSLIPPYAPENINAREDLLVETRKLLLALESPGNVIERVCFQV